MDACTVMLRFVVNNGSVCSSIFHHSEILDYFVCLCFLLITQKFGGLVKLFDRFDTGLVQLQYFKF